MFPKTLFSEQDLFRLSIHMHKQVHMHTRNPQHVSLCMPITVHLGKLTMIPPVLNNWLGL